jgi:hypothetical protein
MGGDDFVAFLVFLTVEFHGDVIRADEIGVVVLYLAATDEEADVADI